MRDNNKFFDIKHARQKSPTPRMVRVPVNLPYMPLSRPAKVTPRSSFKIPLLAAGAIFVLVLGIFGLNILHFKKQAISSAPVIYDRFKQGAGALFNLDLNKAKESFQEASKQLAALNAQAPIKTVPQVLTNLFQLSQSAASVSGILQDLKSNGLGLVINKKGAFLIESFKNLRMKIAEINSLSGELKSQAATLGYQLGNEFSNINTQLGSATEFLDAFISWLEIPKKQRLLIFFQNPSEIRPAGGFIGSYGIATLFQGNLLDLEVRDIYDPDGQLDLKVIPPKPLQGITGKWGARDANWFFDFPTSAQKVANFLEASKIYQEQGIKFAGAIAVNVEVIKDLLEIVGPINLPEYKLAINKENFLKEIQREVETGADKAQNDPKKILKVMTPIIFDRLSNLNASAKDGLLQKMADRFGKKDMMVYFKETTIERYLKELGVAGEVAVLSPDFDGEYLAVVNANVAGGKSDAFINQKIKLESKIDKMGQIQNHLTVERIHGGQNEKDWWYRSTNRDYLQILVAPGSKLIKISGDTPKVVKALVDYRKQNYITDESLKALEKAGALVFGKTAFAKWLEVPAGKTGKLQVDYSSPNRINLAGGVYQLVFDKQSGVNGELEISIEAPEGYKWKEGDSRIFKYANRDLPARISLNLTLVAIPR